MNNGPELPTRERTIHTRLTDYPCVGRVVWSRIVGAGHGRPPAPIVGSVAHYFTEGTDIMTHRIATASLLAAAVAFWAGGASARAQEKKDHIHEGHVVKVADGKLTMVGGDKKEVTHPVPKEAKVTIDGKDTKLEDLKPHTQVKVTMKEEGGKHVVTKIEATTKKEK